MRETEYKRQLRKIVGGWSEVYETRSGGGVGYPDLQFLLGGVLIPVEIKVGEVVGDVLRSSEIRGSQIAWHHNFKKAGGVSVILVCWGPVKQMNAYAVPDTNREMTANWKKGWKISFCEPWVENGKLLEAMVSSWRRRKFFRINQLF